MELEQVGFASIKIELVMTVGNILRIFTTENTLHPNNQRNKKQSVHSFQYTNMVFVCIGKFVIVSYSIQCELNMTRLGFAQ